MTTPRRSPHRTDADRTQRFASHAARLLTDSRCEDAVVLDVRQVSQVTDFIIIATGSSERQMSSTVDDLKALARQEGEQVFGRDTAGTSGWLVVDFVDVVVHLFTPDQRLYYDLESLWGDAKRVDWRSVTEPGQFAKIRVKSS